MPHGLDLHLVPLPGLHPGSLAHLCSPLGQVCGASLDPVSWVAHLPREVLESGAGEEVALCQDEEVVGGLADE